MTESIALYGQVSLWFTQQLYCVFSLLSSLCCQYRSLHLWSNRDWKMWHDHLLTARASLTLRHSEFLPILLLSAVQEIKLTVVVTVDHNKETTRLKTVSPSDMHKSSSMDTQDRMSPAAETWKHVLYMYYTFDTFLSGNDNTGFGVRLYIHRNICTNGRPQFDNRCCLVVFRHSDVGFYLATKTKWS